MSLYDAGRSCIAQDGPAIFAFSLGEDAGPFFRFLKNMMAPKTLFLKERNFFSKIKFVDTQYLAKNPHFVKHKEKKFFKNT